MGNSGWYWVKYLSQLSAKARLNQCEAFYILKQSSTRLGSST
jgi:hypothetical protein